MNPTTERLKLLVLNDERKRSQEQIATEANISKAAMSNYMAGRIPRPEQLTRLATALGVTFDYLMGWSEDRQKKNLSNIRTARIIADSLPASTKEKQELFDALAWIKNHLDDAEKSLGEAQRNWSIINTVVSHFRTTKKTSSSKAYAAEKEILDSLEADSKKHKTHETH